MTKRTRDLMSPRFSERLRSRALQRAFGWAAVISNGLICATGATVRVTGSGLGCPTWPQCQPGSLIPVYREGLAGMHQAIEFANRMLTPVVLIASLGTFLLLLADRPRRSALLKVAAVGPILVAFQGIWGGVVVHTKLMWWTVAPHMLASLVIVVFALITVVRIGEPDTPGRAVVPRAMGGLLHGLLGVLVVLCVTGTLVTSAGPHAGDVHTPRLGLPVQMLAQVHADMLFFYLGLLLATAVALIALDAPTRLRKRMYLTVALTAAQGLIGLVQYATGVPEALVIAHVLGSVLVVTAATWTYLATRERIG